MFRLPFRKLGRWAAFAFLVLWVMGSNFVTEARHEAARPNFIFILTDDHRWDELGFTGNRVVETPNLDQLAAEGVYFDNAYVSSAICTPSRASIFLSQYERRHGVNFNSGTSLAAKAWAQSYPVLLRQAGYFMGYVGKNHVPIGPRGYFDSLMAQSFDYWFAAHNHLGFYPKERHAIFHSAPSETQVEVLGEGAAHFLRPDTSFLSQAATFLNVRPEGQPFCLSLAFNLPHGAGVRSMEQRPTDPALYRTRYRDQPIQLSSLYTPKDSITSPKLPPEVLHAAHRQATYAYVDSRDTLREIKIRRYQTISGIDQLVGQLREILRQEGLEDNTILIFTSDHGIMEGEWGLGGKALCYEACLKVPFIVFDPRQPASLRGRREAAFVQTLDIAPSLLQWAEVPLPETMQGRALQPLLAGDTTGWRKVVFGENLWSTWFGNPRIESVRFGKWKYIRYFENDFGPPPRNQNPYAISPVLAERYQQFLRASIAGEPPVFEELFNLEVDPLEEQNLAGDTLFEKPLNQLRQFCQQEVEAAAGRPLVEPYTIDLIRQWEKK